MPLFQNSVLQNALKFVRGTAFEEAWTKFVAHFHNPIIQENIRKSKEEQYQEGFLNDLFVNVMGYVKNPSPNYNLTTELKNIKNAQKTDGAILIQQKAIAVIELKGMDTTDLSKVEQQAFNYKNNQPNCVYVITSNFEKLRFYIDDAIEFEEFNLFTLDKERFKLLYFCLAKDSLLIGKPKEVKNESLNKEEIITKSLYKDYSNFRTSIFKSIEKLNPKYDKLLLFKKTQKLLDRFLFIFFAEDKGLLAARLIEKIIEDWRTLNEKYSVNTSLYDEYKKYFGYLNTGKQDQHHDIFAYNGGLFAADEILDNLQIDSQLLAQNTLKLSQYDFESEVSVTILGHIFEHSLNELEEIENKLKENKDAKKEITKRKKDGVFYTPKYITNYIVENTVGKLCQQKREELKIDESSIEKEFLSEPNPLKRDKKRVEFLQNSFQEYRKWLLQLTICDPACGSGAFLNQTLEFLIEKHNQLAELEMKLLATTFINPNLEDEILKNNIFGVDINEESVEIAKLSLWLRTAQKGKKLTTLNQNIKVGNSLIDDPKLANEKAFDWKNEFLSVFENGGFDVVVGNPPYVQVDQKLYSNYFTQKCSDLYAYFFEKSTQITKHSSFVGFITPSLFIKGIRYSSLRDYFINNVEIIELSEKEDKIFDDVQMPTAITIFKNHKIEGQDWDNFLEGAKLTKKIAENKIIIGEISDIMRGLEIGKDKVFEEKNDVKFLTGANIDRYKIESFSYIDNKTYEKYKKDNTYFEGDRIIIRETGNRLTLMFLNENVQQNRSLYSIKLKNNLDYSYLYIISILNSQVIQYYYKSKFAANTNIFPKIRISQVKELPIPKISKDLQQPFIVLANQMLSLNEDFNTKKSRFLRRLQDNFAGLTKITKKLDDFYLYSYSDFVKEFQKQKIPFTAFMQDEWEDYFQNYKTDLESLQNKIKETDAQLDKLVFELYGLDEEEIELILNV